MTPRPRRARVPLAALALALALSACNTSRYGGLLYVLAGLAGTRDDGEPPAPAPACAGAAPATAVPDWVPVPGSPFALARTETTKGQYRACMAAGCCPAPLCDADPASPPELPATCLSWHDARAFCAWAGGRLPSEDEWERGARGGGTGPHPWGAEPATCRRAVLGEGAGCDGGEALPACSRPDGNNPLGICDLAGNVAEWVEGDRGDGGEGRPAGDAARPDADRGAFRAAKGGSFVEDGVDAPRIDARARRAATARHANLGFRCAADLPR